MSVSTSRHRGARYGTAYMTRTMRSSRTSRSKTGIEGIAFSTKKIDGSIAAHRAGRSRPVRSIDDVRRACPVCNARSASLTAGCVFALRNLIVVVHIALREMLRKPSITTGLVMLDHAGVAAVERGERRDRRGCGGRRRSGIRWRRRSRGNRIAVGIL